MQLSVKSCYITILEMNMGHSSRTICNTCGQCLRVLVLYCMNVSWSSKLCDCFNINIQETLLPILPQILQWCNHNKLEISMFHCICNKRREKSTHLLIWVWVHRYGNSDYVRMSAWCMCYVLGFILLLFNSAVCIYWLLNNTVIQVSSFLAITTLP